MVQIVGESANAQRASVVIRALGSACVRQGRRAARVVKVSVLYR